MTTLERGRWTTANFDALQRIVDTAGPGSTAAFDFDGTVICWDISEATIAEGVRRGIFTDENVLDLVCPQVDGVGWRDGIVRYYEVLSDCDTRRGTHFGHYPGSLWTAQVFAGHTLATYRDCIDGGVAHADGPRPIPEIVDLMDALIARGVEVHIVTAGISWAVRRMVCEHINPLMHRSGGIPPERVLGITGLLQDRRSGALLTDDAAIAKYGRDFLLLDPAVCDGLAITALAGGGLSFAGGKVAALLDRHDRAELYFAAGDGGGDMPLMTIAQHGLWLADDSKPVSADLRARAVGLGALIQPVRGRGELLP